MIRIVQQTLEFWTKLKRNPKPRATVMIYAMRSVFFLGRRLMKRVMISVTTISVLPITRLSIPKLKPMSSMAY
jgi:hypothetical protein